MNKNPHFLFSLHHVLALCGLLGNNSHGRRLQISIQSQGGQFYGCLERGAYIRHWPALPGRIVGSVLTSLRTAAEASSFRWGQFQCSQQDRRGPWKPAMDAEGLP